jgi:hypothetical protein
LGMPQPQGAGLPPPRLHPPHAAKAMQSCMMFPDRLLAIAAFLFFRPLVVSMRLGIAGVTFSFGLLLFHPALILGLDRVMSDSVGFFCWLAGVGGIIGFVAASQEKLSWGNLGLVIAGFACWHNAFRRRSNCFSRDGCSRLVVCFYVSQGGWLAAAPSCRRLPVRSSRQLRSNSGAISVAFRSCRLLGGYGCRKS